MKYLNSIAHAYGITQKEALEEILIRLMTIPDTPTQDTGSSIQFV